MVFRRSFTVTNNTIINKEGNKHDISTKQRQRRKRVSFQDRKNENKPKFPSIIYDITQYSQRRYLRIIGVIYNVFIK